MMQSMSMLVKTQDRKVAKTLKTNKDKDLKILEQKTKSKDNDKGSRSNITKHEGTSLQQDKDQNKDSRTKRQSNLNKSKEWTGKAPSKVLLQCPEYIAASEAAMEGVWIRKFIPGLGIIPTINEPIKMFSDNSAALYFANEPRVQNDVRHYHRRYHYVREYIVLGEIKLLKVLTDNNLADPFTKALSNEKHTQHARSMGLLLASSFMYICV
ncbi:hypothetical protein Tco_1109399 [Tanacetum coccineum]